MPYLHLYLIFKIDGIFHLSATLNFDMSPNLKVATTWSKLCEALITPSATLEPHRCC